MRSRSIHYTQNQGWKWGTPVNPFDPLTHMHAEQSGCDPLVTHMVKFSFLKVAIVTWHEFFWYMEQCHRFLHPWQDTEPVPCTDFLKMKYLDFTCFKTTWDKNKLVSYQWYFSTFIRPKVYSLIRCQHYFLKNMWYPGHIQII